MANPLAEGTWPCVVISAIAAEEVDQAGKSTGIIKARVNVKIDDGPSKGRTCMYEDDINAKSSLYVFRTLKAVGWKHAPNLATVAADVENWIKETGGKSVVEIRHVPIKRGRKFDQWMADGQRGDPPIWDKVNSIGRGPKPLAAPSKTALDEANEAMRRAMADDGSAPDDQPASDDIPFATSSMRAGLGEIAAVLK